MTSLSPLSSDLFPRELERAISPLLQGISFPSMPAIKLKLTEESDTAWAVAAEVPGVDASELSLAVDEDAHTLSITVTKKVDEAPPPGLAWNEFSFQGSCERVLTLPPHVDLANVTSTLKDGVLSVKVPKLPGAISKRNIPVQLA